MISRVANSVYWMFRYLERAQNIARFINADFSQSLEDPRNQNNLWSSLIAVSGDEEEFLSRYQNTTKENVIQFLTVDENNPNSILSTVRASRENARSIRETLSLELWEEINGLYHSVKDFRKHQSEMDPFLFCKSVLQSCYLVIGLFYSTMNRSDSWHFGRIGMLLERADKTSRILDVKYFLLLPEASWVGNAYDRSQWSALLKAVSGLEMYRKRYRRITPKNVAEFLIFDRLYPRSVFHCIHFATNSLNHVTGYIPHGILNPAQKILFNLNSQIETGEIQEVLDRGMHEFLDALQTKINAADDAIYQGFFGTKIKSSNVRGGFLGQQGQNQS